MRSLMLVTFVFLGFLWWGMPVSAQTCNGGNGVCTDVLECPGYYTVDIACNGTVCCLNSDSNPQPPAGPVACTSDDSGNVGVCRNICRNTEQTETASDTCGRSNGYCCVTYTQTINTCTGTCRQISLGCTAPEQPVSGTCASNQMCCDITGNSVVNECTAVPGARCTTITNGCVAGETPSNRACSSNQMCCDAASGGPGGSITNECTAVPGARCTTITNGCVAGETPSNRACSSNQMCCDTIGGVGGPGPGPGGPGPGTNNSNCSDPNRFEKIAGVCFPKSSSIGLSDKSVLDILESLVTWILAIFGFIAILGFIISGIQYLLSAGDEGQAETAKRNMQYSIIGIIVALSGWIIIQAVDALLNARTLA